MLPLKEKLFPPINTPAIAPSRPSSTLLLVICSFGQEGGMLPSMHKKYPETLTTTEREYLQQLIAAGTTPARTLTHARILLKADQSPGGPCGVDEAIAEAVEVSQPTIARVRKQFVEEGTERTRRALLHSPAARHSPDRRAGHSGCSLTRSSNLRSSRTSRTRPSAGCPKKTNSSPG